MTNKECIEYAAEHSFLDLYLKGWEDAKEYYTKKFEEKERDDKKWIAVNASMK